MLASAASVTRAFSMACDRYSTNIAFIRMTRDPLFKITFSVTNIQRKIVKGSSM